MKGMEFGFICIMDALGIKGAWKDMEPDEFVKSIKELEKGFRGAIENVREGGETYSAGGKLDFQLFSDTVFITFACADRDFGVKASVAQSFLHLPWFSNVVVGPFCHALMEGLFFRGAIAQGYFHQEESILLGPAVDDAARYYERANWLGVLLTPAATLAAQYAVAKWEELGISEQHALVEYDVPMSKGDAERLMVVNWPAFFRQVHQGSGEKASPKQHLAGMLARHPIPPEARQKYVNALAFFDACADDGGTGS